MSLNKKFKPPANTSEQFKKYWNVYIDLVSSRDNFEEAHLYQLKVLCETQEEYENLKASLSLTGPTFMLCDKMGNERPLMRPEVEQVNKLRKQMLDFMKMLGIALNKDKLPGRKGVTNEEWE